MFFRKTLFKPQTSLAIATMLTACSGSLDGGSLTGSFTGISNVRVLGPETIEISWQIRSSCTQYRIFDLTKDTQSPVEVATIPPVKLTAPKIKDATHYTFSVGCADSSGNVSGLGINLSADSLPKFTGELTGTLDGSSDLDRMPKLAWKYPQGTMTTFEIYYKEAVYPGDQSAWALQGSPANGYLGNLLCQTMANQVKIGPGQDCDTDTLESGHVYDFKVVARYPDGSHSLDLASPTTAVQLPIPSKFTDPPCTLTTLGIGSSKTNSHLILRCNSSAPTATCHHIRAQAFQFDPVTHTEVSISELLDGDGSVAIQPAAPAGINDREIQNLEIKFWCEDTTTHKWNQLVRYYDGVNGHEATPRLKYATERYEAAPPKASKDNPSFLGRSTAIGDFDCDGQPDLAIGLPDLSINEDGYANTAPQSGAVRVLYNYKMNGTNLSYAYSKYISFNDLPNYTRFGSALSAGNINRDYRMVLHNNKTQYYSCDDLIVGAPGGTSIGTGFATVFFGHEGGLVATDRYLSSIAVNTPSCSGSVCNPVKLVGGKSQDQANLKVYPLTHGGQYVPNINWDPTDNFASAVAYAGDFNADGYGDVAIGYPGCNWDGWAINNEDLSTSTPGVYRSATPPPQQVGCVYMFWGGKNGITPV
ncbi:MAG: hypothetical protein EBX52_10400, partial [Proteobacteria bacterium]|nr:hypothetical protein [Pseudomonadota bacterium]